MKRRVSGFSLTELLIAMLLSAVLLAVLLLVLNNGLRIAKQSSQLAFVQQNGQAALSLLRNELQNMAFWGGGQPDLLRLSFSDIAAPAADCVQPGMDSGSFVQPNEPFLTILALTATSGSQLNCLSNILAGTELLQLKRAIGYQSSRNALRHNRFYLEAGWQHLRFVSAASSGLNEQYRYFPYQHVVYYIQEQITGDLKIPVLMRKRLIRTAAGQAGINTDSVVDGIERLHFEFGVNHPANLRATQQMTAVDWQQVVSIRFHVLVRSNEADLSYRNDQLYQMGQVQFQAPGDHYRRLLLSSTVFFRNAVLPEQWP